MASDVEGLYAAVKALVCVVKSNPLASKEMERIKGYQVCNHKASPSLFFVLKRKQQKPSNFHYYSYFFKLWKNYFTQVNFKTSVVFSKTKNFYYFGSNFVSYLIRSPFLNSWIRLCYFSFSVISDIFASLELFFSMEIGMKWNRVILPAAPEAAKSVMDPELSWLSLSLPSTPTHLLPPPPIYVTRNERHCVIPVPLLVLKTPLGIKIGGVHMSTTH